MTTDVYPRYTEVVLTWREVALAASAGTSRRIWNKRNKTRRLYGVKWTEGEGWHRDILACCAEYAVAKLTGRHWCDMGRGYLKGADDVVGLQVRHTVYADGKLTVHKEDVNDKPFVLVTGVDPRFRVCGWLYGREAKQEPYWTNLSMDEERFAYNVEQERLHPMCELPPP